MTTPKDERTWEERIVEVVHATYPRDLWPDPEDTSHLKDGNVAYIMREMARAIASITKQSHEDALHTHQAALAEKLCTELYEGSFMDNGMRNIEVYHALAIIRRHLTPDKK